MNTHLTRLEILRSVSHAPGTHRERYCASAAVSSITGCTAERAAVLINRRRNHNPQRQCSLVYDHEIEWAVHDHGGYHLIRYTPPGEHRTVGQWVKHMHPEDQLGVFLILTRTHFLVLRGCGFVDSIHNNPRKIRHGRYHWASARLHRVWACYRCYP